MKSGAQMRIEKLILKNYRQFRDSKIIFPQRSEADLHIIIGVMGTGKTNILNAINWCLYGDEPHLSKDSNQLPVLNLIRGKPSLLIVVITNSPVVPLSTSWPLLGSIISAIKWSSLI